MRFHVALLVMAALVAIASGAGLSTASHPDRQTDAASSLADPAVSAAVHEAVTTAERHAAQRNTADARTSRAASRTRFGDVSDDAAFAIARDHFGHLIGDRGFRPFGGNAGGRVERYLDGDRSALLDTGASKAIVDSTLPLRGTTADGDRAPVDLRLAARDGSFEPVSSPVRATLPRDLTEPVTIPYDGGRLAIRPLVDRGAAGRAEGDDAFYPNVARDTDAVATALPTGVELSDVVRSPEGPERFTFGFDGLPDGAKLTSLGDGHSAAIVAGGERLASIAAPTAVDADGEPLPVALSVDGANLELRVAHRDRDVAYPVLVDPLITLPPETFTWGNATTNNDFTGWSYTNVQGSGSPSHTVPLAGAHNGPWGPGLYSYTTGGTAYYLDDGINRWFAPAEAYIYRADFNGIANWNATGSPAMCTNAGIFSTTRNAADSTFYLNCAYIVGVNWGICVSGTHPNCSTTAGTDGNDAQMDFWASSTNYRAPFSAVTGSGAIDYLAGAALYLSDRVNPGVQWSGDPPSYDWSDYAGPFGVLATDDGLGVKTVTMKAPTTAPGWAGASLTSSCNGTRADRAANRCGPQTVNFSLSGLPEGLQTLHGGATDVVGNSGGFDYGVKIDRTGPSVTPSGTLWSSQGQTLAAGTYNLHVDAADGSTTATAANARSGLQTIEIKIDGETETVYTQPSCSSTGCAGSTDYTLDTADWPAQQHTLDIVATDVLGHTTTRSTTFTVAGEAPLLPEIVDSVLLPTEAPVNPPSAAVAADAPKFRPLDLDAYVAEKTAALTDLQVDDPLDPVETSSSTTDLTPPASPSVTRNPDVRNGLSELCCEPSDSTGVIGPNHYVETVNEEIGIYNRNALIPAVTTSLPQFAGAPSASVFDPQVLWDPATQHWYYAMDREDSNANYLAFGWSKTSDPSNLVSGWCHFFVPTGQTLEDYPKLGDSLNHMVIGTNVFIPDPDHPGKEKFLVSRIWAIPKPVAADQSCTKPRTFRWGTTTNRVFTRDGDEMSTPVPAQTSNTSGRAGYVVAADRPPLSGAANQIQTWHVSGQRMSPALTKDANIGVAQFKVPPDISQPGTDRVLDTVDARLTQAIAVRDPAVNDLAVWTSHTIRAPTGRARLRWYELRPRASTPRRQQGNIENPSQSVFNGAVSPTTNGGAAIQYNVGSNTLAVQVRARSRLSSTTLGRMTNEITLATSPSAYTGGTCFDDEPEKGSRVCRWGDYAGTSPDLSQSNAVWGTNTLVQAGLTSNLFTTRNFQLTAAP